MQKLERAPFELEAGWVGGGRGVVLVWRVSASRFGREGRSKDEEHSDVTLDLRGCDLALKPDWLIVSRVMDSRYAKTVFFRDIASREVAKSRNCEI